MDTSKEYIQMCEKAKEIQAKNYSCLISWKADPSRTIYVDNEDNLFYSPFVWLPRQDQLIEMIEYDIKITRDSKGWTIEGFKKRLDADWLLRTFHFDNTLEKTLLKLVMWQKFTKSWVNGDWRPKK